MSNSNIWPLIIISDRYGGTYSGGEFVAWNCYINQLPPEQAWGDCECCDFWANYDGYPICGKGATIEEALKDLQDKLTNHRRSGE